MLRAVTRRSPAWSAAGRGARRAPEAQPWRGAPAPAPAAAPDGRREPPAAQTARRVAAEATPAPATAPDAHRGPPAAQTARVTEATPVAMTAPAWSAAGCGARRALAGPAAGRRSKRLGGRSLSQTAATVRSAGPVWAPPLGPERVPRHPASTRGRAEVASPRRRGSASRLVALQPARRPPSRLPQRASRRAVRARA